VKKLSNRNTETDTPTSALQLNHNTQKNSSHYDALNENNIYKLQPNNKHTHVNRETKRSGIRSLYVNKIYFVHYYTPLCGSKQTNDHAITGVIPRHFTISDWASCSYPKADH